MKFEDDMSVVNAVWRDCQMRLDQWVIAALSPVCLLF